MPPSPAMRCSPGRELRADNHKRGRSLENGMLLKRRDDDLALFNEVQSRERDDFLLQSNDDFEDTFANKLRHFSDYKLAISIPTRGESSDLLHAEEEKNDYEWLITPPDTPLFPSLDDEMPEANLAQRGRTRTQPISISRSSTMEKSHRSSRGSASPNRFSPSPRSTNSTFESRGRAFSAPSSSPPTSLRPTSATTCRPSPPPRKPAPLTPRVSPTPRRSSTGSNCVSPVKTIRENSASPKVRAWQSSIPGFSTEVPPNLRTSLADRPASYIRGSSPASRNSRQSMSPTASRSIGSSRSKGSVGSSVDDDVESLPSVVIGSTQRSGSRRVGGFPNGKALISKKPSRTGSSSSAPKRSFDLALRQMDNRKGPQNMFRPLLSSVPSSSFYTGMSSSAHRTLISRNSSVTTSSNASSGLHDHELNRDDATSGPVQGQNSNFEDEMFVLEKDSRTEARDELNDSRLVVVEDTKNGPGLLICLRCGCGYDLSGLVGPDPNVCADCVGRHERLTVVDPETEAQIVPEVDGKVKGRHDGQSTYGEPIWNFLSGSSLSRSRSEECAPTVDFPDSKVDLPNSNGDFSTLKVDFSSSEVDFVIPMVDFSSSKVDFLSSSVDSLDPKVDILNSNVDSSNQKSDFSSLKVDFSNLKVDSLEGAGISILLKRSNSIKGSVVRNTNFSASSISYDDFSYVRDSTNSIRSVSAISSVDIGTVKQMDTRFFNRQLSSTKSEIENYKFDLNPKHQRTGSSLSGASSHAFHPSSIENDENTLQTVSNQTRVDSGESFEGVDTCALETCTFEENVMPPDIAEVPLDAISEGEFNRVSKCDGSRSSKSSVDELLEARVSTDLDKDVAIVLEDLDSSNHESNIIEESTVLLGCSGGPKGRSLTLEEATDTILFCSSIVHKLAYEAATIASENQILPDPSGNTGGTASWPLIPATGKHKTELQSRNTTKQFSKSQKSRHKKVAEPDTTKALITTDNAATDHRKTRIVGIRDSGNFESKKPPMLESKCNCTIM